MPFGADDVQAAGGTNLFAVLLALGAEFLDRFGADPFAVFVGRLVPELANLVLGHLVGAAAE